MSLKIDQSEEMEKAQDQWLEKPLDDLEIAQSEKRIAKLHPLRDLGLLDLFPWLVYVYEWVCPHVLNKKVLTKIEP